MTAWEESVNNRLSSIEKSVAEIAGWRNRVIGGALAVSAGISLVVSLLAKSLK